MLLDEFKKLLFTTDFYSLMAGCLYFITYRFNVMGWHISLLNCIVLSESFDLIMTYIGRMFGKEEVNVEE